MIVAQTVAAHPRREESKSSTFESQIEPTALLQESLPSQEIPRHETKYRIEDGKHSQGVWEDAGDRDGNEHNGHQDYSIQNRCSNDLLRTRSTTEEVEPAYERKRHSDYPDQCGFSTDKLRIQKQHLNDQVRSGTKIPRPCIGCRSALRTSTHSTGLQAICIRFVRRDMLAFFSRGRVVM